MKDPLKEYFKNLESLRKKHEAEANAIFEKVMEKHIAEEKRKREMASRSTETRINDLEAEVARLRKEIRIKK